MRRTLVIYDFATAPFWISLYMRKMLFSFFIIAMARQSVSPKFFLGVSSLFLSLFEMAMLDFLLAGSCLILLFQPYCMFSASYWQLCMVVYVVVSFLCSFCNRLERRLVPRESFLNYQYLAICCVTL